MLGDSWVGWLVDCKACMQWIELYVGGLVVMLVVRLFGR